LSDDFDDVSRAVLRARADRLRATPDEDASDSTYWVAAFGLGDERFSVSLPEMLAVLPLTAVTPVPLAPNAVLGMLRFQGALIPALSLASMLVGRAVRRDPVALVIVSSTSGRVVALDCEQIPGVIGIDPSRVAIARDGVSEPFVELTAEDGEPINLLDVDVLLTEGAAFGSG